jgi:hypothetical protein
MRRNGQGKASRALGQRRLSDLIAAHAAAEGLRVRTKAREAQVVFGSRDEERAGVGDLGQSRKVHVGAVEQVERPGFENECIEPQHVVGTCRTHFDLHRNRTTQVELCVQLDARFGRTKLGPRKKLQGQVDGRRVQFVDRLVQIQPEVFAGIKSSRTFDQSRRQILPQPPVALLVGFGQGHPCHRFAQSEMVKRGRAFGVQAFLDVAQTLAPRQLRKARADQLLPVTEVSRVNAVALGQTRERLAVDPIDDLSENVATGVRGRRSCKQAFPTSNPPHQLYCASLSSSMPTTKYQHL